MRIGRAFIVMLVLPVLWAPPAMALDPLVPPDVVSPADGASIAAGSSVTFRVQTEPNDDYLWVRISKSPNPVEACGTIDDDVGIRALEPTGTDPAVYEGTPTNFDLYDFWLNRAGTYYWQAYRIHYGGGADGCVEAPVRSLVITGVRAVEIGPQPLEPPDGAVLPTGGIAFRVAARADDTEKYLWVHVSRSAQVDATGILGDDTEIEELTRTGDPSTWSAIPAYYTFPTFWMNTAGTYYWQPFRISSFGDPDGYVQGPVRSFTLQGGPAPTPTPTPTPPVTIRGDEAFTKGTANDLYLACRTLDLYLVDVLPSGTRVSVTGAADLRLAGKTATILLDGKAVGGAVIGPGGAFATRVKAPTRARRSRARYQARVGATRSQNLKLQRRMVAVKLTRSGDRFTLTGRIRRPFAKRPARIGIQRYVACGRRQTVKVRAVRPTRTGAFKVSFPVPSASVKALMFRATTKVASRAGGRARLFTYTLPRAIDVG